LGMLSRDTGHSRVPAPPHMITGIRRLSPIARHRPVASQVPSTGPMRFKNRSEKG
jgi:hypothetical protein